MADVFDIYTIIFLALAVFIFLRLRSVLGQRTGRERPPYDPYSARDAVRSPAYRDAKVRTLLETAVEVLGPGSEAPVLGLADDLGHEHPHPAIVLVSNKRRDRAPHGGACQPSHRWYKVGAGTPVIV